MTYEHKTIKARILTKEITNCYFCPNNNLYSSWCRLLKRTIEHPEEFFDRPIPEDCPLPVREYKITKFGKELLGQNKRSEDV